MLYGTSSIRYLKALGVARGDAEAAAAYANARTDWRDRSDIVRLIKAGVGAPEAAALEGDGVAGVDFLAALRPLTLVGRLPLRRVPPRLQLLTQVVGSEATWVGEGAARRMTVGQYDRQSLTLKQIAALSVATNELLSDVSLESESVILNDLLAACGEALDRAFIDLGNVGDAITPASITSTATPISATASLDDDLSEAIQQLSDAGSNLRSAFWVMSAAFAARLSLVRGSGGAQKYPDIGALDGRLCGLPILTTASAAEPSDSDGTGDIVLLDASQISIVEGPPTLRVSEQALIELSDAPTGHTITPTAASQHYVSMFQADASALMAQLAVNWLPRRAGMVAVISGVAL